MKTPEEIKKGLECCASFLFDCPQCPYYEVGDGDCVDEVKRDALAYIRQLEARVPRWIPVEERLPEELTDVLTKCGHGAAWFYGLAYLFEGKWKVDGIGGSVDIVTHWMPLPEPPEEGKE